MKTLHHSNPDDPHGPPDVELFWHGGSTDLVTGDGPAKRGWYWWYVPERYIAHGPFPCEEAALDNAQMKDSSIKRTELANGIPAPTSALIRRERDPRAVFPNKVCLTENFH